MNPLIAYHITWGTHGTRLPGSDKPHVRKDQNEFDSPLPEPDPELEVLARKRMTQPSVRLTYEHRQFTVKAIENVAKRYGWTIHAIAAQSDHVHVVITANRVGNELRDALKAVSSKALNKQFADQKWWAVGGSCKYIYYDSYFENAVNYVRDQREI
jgi:REP element-mobilizing transposase RayT